MNILLFWLLPTLLYAFVGFFLFLYHRKSIVITNRQPKVVLIEQLSVFVWCVLCIFTFDPEFAAILTCEYSESLISGLSLISISLMLARMSFVYKYLIHNDVKRSKYNVLSFISRIYWTKSNNLRKKRVFAGSVTLALLSVANVVFYHSVENIWNVGYPACNDFDGETYFAEFTNIFMGIVLLAFTFELIRYKIKDQIGMTVEVIAYTLSISIVIVGYLALFGRFDHIMILLEGYVSLFYGLYFPVFIHWRHASVSNLEKSVKISLTDLRVTKLCKEFYCEENSLFIEKYNEYCKKKVSYKYIIDMFIEEGSLNELNITSDTRESALLAKTEQEMKEALMVVYEEIVLIIRQNILPYLANSSTRLV